MEEEEGDNQDHSSRPLSTDPTSRPLTPIESFSCFSGAEGSEPKQLERVHATELLALDGGLRVMKKKHPGSD